MIDHKDDFRAAASAQPASHKQIDDLAKQYHTEQPVMEYTPMGNRWVELLTPDQRRENAQITDKRLFMMRRLQKQQNKAKEGLNNAADRRSGADRRQRDNDNGR